MSVLERFEAYAADFEKSFADNDWSRIRPYFTDDAVYDTTGIEALTGRTEGADAICAQLEGALDGFDRKFDKRVLRAVVPTVEKDGKVIFTWEIIYSKDGLPDLRFEGVETATYDGDRICLLADVFDAAGAEAMGEWMAKYGEQLG